MKQNQECTNRDYSNCLCFYLFLSVLKLFICLSRPWCYLCLSIVCLFVSLSFLQSVCLSVCLVSQMQNKKYLVLWKNSQLCIVRTNICLTVISNNLIILLCRFYWSSDYLQFVIVAEVLEYKLYKQRHTVNETFLSNNKV